MAYLLPLGLGVVTRTKLVAGLSAAGLAVHVIWMGPLFVPDGPRHGDRLTVLSTNLEYGAADTSVVVQLVREHDVDLLAVQELTSDSTPTLRAELARLLPYSYLRPEPHSAAGSGIWSRYPLRDEGTIDPMYFRNLRATVDLGTERGELTFAAVHPVPPGIGSQDDPDHEVLRNGLAKLARSRDRVVVAGDFNATYDHGTIQRLLDLGLVDAADRAGAGVVPTWPAGRGIPPALYGIDHVLVDSDIGVTDFDRSLVPATDHYAVSADLVLP